MQILKDDIRERITATATRLFYAHGFGETSMRQIADEVGMSVSNLYKYFKNKEDLFGEIVKAYHDEYLTGFKRFVSHEERESFDSDGNNMLAQALFDSIKSNPMKFVLLMDKSKGTRYGNFKNEVAAILSEHILRGISQASKRKYKIGSWVKNLFGRGTLQTNEQEYMIKILVRNFFNGVVAVAKDYNDDEWALQNLSLLAKYHMNGMKALYEQ